MLFNASTTPCSFQCSTIVSNLFCCDQIYLPGLFFKNVYAFPRECELGTARRGRSCLARRHASAFWGARARHSRVPSRLPASLPAEDRGTLNNVFFEINNGSGVMWESRVHGVFYQVRTSWSACSSGDNVLDWCPAKTGQRRHRGAARTKSMLRSPPESSSGGCRLPLLLPMTQPMDFSHFPFDRQGVLSGRCPAAACLPLTPIRAHMWRAARRSSSLRTAWRWPLPPMLCSFDLLAEVRFYDIA